MRVQWARENGCEWDEIACATPRRREATWSPSGARCEWARQPPRCEWDEETCEAAAKGGHLEVLQWARQNGCPWNELTCSAAAGGHLDVLQWAHENGCPWDK